MNISRGALWAILIGFFVLTGTAIVLVNKNVYWSESDVVEYETEQVLDVW